MKKIDYRPVSQRFRRGTRAAEKITLWDSWLRRDSLKAIGRAFGKPSSLFIASWSPVLRRPVEITDQSGQSWILASDALSAFAGNPKRIFRYGLVRQLGTLALLLCCFLFRWRIYKPIETGKTLILFLYKAAILHSLSWSGNLLGLRRYLLVIAVQALLALIFNLKASTQRLYGNLRHRESREIDSGDCK